MARGGARRPDRPPAAYRPDGPAWLPTLLALSLLASSSVLLGCSGDEWVGQTAIPPPLPVDEVGAWDATPQTFATTFYVRPPGEQYGSDDGSSWTNAFSDLPAALQRGAQYYVAAGEYDEAEPDGEAYVDHTFEDPEDGEQFIGIFKATEQDHGSEDGWDSLFAEGPARFGPFAFVTGRYIIDGQTGEAATGHGIHVAVKPEACPSSHSLTLYFNWNAQSHFIGLHHLDISHCGGVGDPEGPAQDAIYGYHTDDSEVSNVTIKHCYVHDTKRVLTFILGWTNVLIEDSYYERSGQHHESSSLAMRDAENVVVRRNVFKDAINVYVSLQTVRHVHLYSNVFVGTIDGWDIWNSIHSSEPLTNVFIYGNTFYNLTGLSTGLRFSGTTTNLQVFNNIWAHNRTNQIPMAGDHDFNAFWDNWRVDTDPHQDLNEQVDEPNAQVLDADPFVDGEALDFHLTIPTDPGATLPAPYDLDHDGLRHGQDGVWDRGAFERSTP